jgi:glycerol-3-phosphate acyltransferase PlsY
LTDYFLVIAIGYLLGSIPFGVMAGWLVKRVDVRDYGSGSTGMTNVLRTIGRPAAALVLLLDMGKAVLAVALARVLSADAGVDAAAVLAPSADPGVDAAAALAALVGHVLPLFISFRGGKGTAIGWGALLILSPISGLVATVVGLAALGLSRYMSLGSVVAATAGTATLVVLALTGQEPLVYIWFSVIGGPIVVARHKDNIKRLLAGEERKLGQSVDVGASNDGQRRGVGWPGSA